MKESFDKNQNENKKYNNQRQNLISQNNSLFANRNSSSRHNILSLKNKQNSEQLANKFEFLNFKKA